MSKLDDILDQTNMITHLGAEEIGISKSEVKEQTKALILELIDETVIGLGGDIPYGELTRKIEAL